MTATIEEQADEVGREVRQRERIYPKWIEERRLKADTAAKKLATMRDAERSLRFIARHAVGLRALAAFLIATPAGSPPIPTEAERAALLAHPAVKALLEVWPDAEVSIFQAAPIAPPSASGDLFEGAEADA